MRPTAVILTDGLYATPSAKTAHGLVRGPSRYQIVGLVDAACAGRDAGDVLDGRRRDIPVFASLEACLSGLARKPAWCVIGVATSGGVLPEGMRPVVRAAIDAGLSVVNGLHEILSDDRELAAAAARRGVDLVDLRRPRKRAELHFWTGAIRSVRAPRVAVLGTDCALGKRTTCQVLAAACRAQGIATGIVYTGQTGWLQGLEHGFVLDATPNDFVSGELEHAIVRCDREARPDLILLEGQSALRNPSGPCGAELLVSAGTRAVVLQHAPARRFFDDQEHLGNEIPPLPSEVALIAMYGARVLAIALNDEHLAPAEREAARRRVEAETGRPALYPLFDDPARLVALVAEHVASERAR